MGLADPTDFIFRLTPTALVRRTGQGAFLSAPRRNYDAARVTPRRTVTGDPSARKADVGRPWRHS